MKLVLLAAVLVSSLAGVAGSATARADSVHTPSGRCIVLRVDIPAIWRFDKDFVLRAYETCPLPIPPPETKSE